MTEVIICIVPATSILPSPSRGGGSASVTSSRKPPAGRRTARAPWIAHSDRRANCPSVGFTLQRRPKNVTSMPPEKCWSTSIPTLMPWSSAYLRLTAPPGPAGINVPISLARMSRTSRAIGAKSGGPRRSGEPQIRAGPWHERGYARRPALFRRHRRDVLRAPLQGEPDARTIRTPIGVRDPRGTRGPSSRGRLPAGGYRCAPASPRWRGQDRRRRYDANDHFRHRELGSGASGSMALDASAMALIGAHPMVFPDAASPDG